MINSKENAPPVIYNDNTALDTLLLKNIPGVVIMNFTQTVESDQIAETSDDNDEDKERGE